MKFAYNREWLYNIHVIKETKRWAEPGLITKEQLTAIHAAHPCGFHHPNFIIRILLFIATLLALSGVTGLLGLMVASAGEDFIWIGCLLYGIGSFVFLEAVFISNSNHYKSGVTEALLYHSCLFTIVGLGGMIDFESEYFVLITCCVVFAFAAFRYLDLVCTLAFLFCSAWLLFLVMYEASSFTQQTMPFIFIGIFLPLYFFVKDFARNEAVWPWRNNLLIIEAVALIVVYLAGNYLVVRELSVEMLGLYLEEGEDIPFAIVFYALTVITPCLYLYFGIRNKDIVLIRVSLALIAFSVFTFKYYYSLGHPEITFTIAGAILIVVSLWILNFLKTMQRGYTRENLLSEKWADSNLQAFIVSQTIQGNQVVSGEEGFKGGGGGFSGGGASGEI